MSTAIHWPDRYTPGTTDNYVSNEVIAKDVTAAQIWALLADITKWETYYWNCTEITPPKSGPKLEEGNDFQFSTFGFPPLPCTIRESVAPSASQPGRIAWEAVTDGEGGKTIYVYHAWIVEDLPGGRVRILTQESQIGDVFKDFAGKKPNPMLNGHQDWLDGLVKAARGEKPDEPGAWSRFYRRNVDDDLTIATD
ncbi:uncharacterized protein MYCGRDRAFT_68113, partial [Zymoseptoria tritici IPO323]